ncbi:hypothetical protein QAD02_019899 [Eretmocerus hayati]|uniref:Uncharacterized protein n=1 Tax=Eretmocerus hayati TaxID=131215 RepID=A0ACC2PKY4_9HYME|nr:hypothetical protein QAD02_019899 [Eretmocerus hayati]
MWSSSVLLKCLVQNCLPPCRRATQVTLKSDFNSVSKMALQPKSHTASNPSDRMKSSAKPPEKPNLVSVDAITMILKKHNIDTDGLSHKTRIFTQKPWVIDKKIKILQELGVPTVTWQQINNFTLGMNLPVHTFKSNVGIGRNVNLARKIFSSHLQKPKTFWMELDQVSEETVMRTFCIQCTVKYVQSEVRLSDEKLKAISAEKDHHPFYNSLRLLERMLKLLKNQLHFEDSLIEENISLLQYHPEYAESVVKILQDEFKDDALKILRKYPSILKSDPENLRKLIHTLKKYELTSNIFSYGLQIFKMDAKELVRRVEYLLHNPYTLVFQKHRNFMSLVKCLPLIIPKLNYLQARNHKFTTIHTLTHSSSNMDQLCTVKRMYNRNLISFFETQFQKDGMELLNSIKRHPHYRLVSLVQMYETSVYLKEHFPMDTIIRHIYSTLYEKSHLKSAHEALLQDPENQDLRPDQLLAMCIYKLEEKYHFTGEGVFREMKPREGEEDDGKEKTLDEKSLSVENR